MNYIVLLIIIAITLFLFKNNFKNRASKINSKIPGPIGLPVLGNLLSISSDAHLVLQNWYNKFGPIYKIDMGYAISCVVLTEYPTIRKAFIENSDIFAPRFQLSSRLFVNKCADIALENGVKHSILKKVILSEMTPIKIKKQEIHIKNECIKLMAHLDQHAVDGKPFLLNKYMSMFSLNIILRFFFGVDFPYQQVEETTGVVAVIKEFFIGAGDFLISDYIPVIPHSKTSVFYTSYQKMVKEIEKLIASHNNRDDDSILSKLLKEYENGSINWDGVVATCATMILAGTDTSSNSMMFCVVEMINNQSMQSKLYNDINTSVNKNGDQDDVAGEDMFILTQSKYRQLMPYLSLVIKEVYRKYPIGVLGLPHKTTEDVVIDGKIIAKDTMIIQNIYATHRSEKYYPSPNEFIPERFIENSNNGSNINLATFGCGQRDCVGKGLAETEIFTMLASIFNRYEFSNPNPSTPLSEKGTFGLALQCPDTTVLIKRR